MYYFLQDFPSTCTKSVINLLDNSLEKSRQSKEMTMDQQRLTERSYILLYSLCCDPRTSDVILRFLRSCNDFLCRHISGLPFNGSNTSHVLSQMSNLLKCVAIELKQTSSSNQITQFGNLCKILLGVVQSSIPDATPIELLHFHSSMIASNSIMEAPASKKPTDSKLLLCLLLDGVGVEVKQVEKPKWDYFDGAMLVQLIKSCEVIAPSGGKLINMKKLHDILRDEINSVQSSLVVGHLNHILHEMEAVLEYALQLNEQKNSTSATVKFLEAWGQVTEILFSVAPSYVIANDVKQTLILEILQALLTKVC